MARTKTQIATEALQIIGELATGQTPTDADLQVAIAAYEQVWMQLQTPEYLATWGAEEDIPSEAVKPIVALVASEISPHFGVQGQTLQQVEARASNAYPQLRTNLHSNWVPATVTEMEYY